MVRQEAMLGSPCRKSQLLDDLISWHRYGLNFFSIIKNLVRSCSVHSTGQKNPCIRKFIPGVKFQLSPNSMSNSMSFNNELTMFRKINPLKKGQNSAFACGKIEGLPPLFCFSLFLSSSTNWLVALAAGMVVGVRTKGRV